MKRLFFSFLLFGFVSLSKAQKADASLVIISDSLVTLTTTSNSVFEGKVKAQDGSSILLDTKMGPINFSYAIIKDVRNKAGAVIFTPPPAAGEDTDPLSAYHVKKKPLYNLPDSAFNSNKKYYFWNKCWLIHNGDTVWVKVEPAADYRRKTLIRAVKRSGEQRALAPEDIVKMVIFYDEQQEPYIYVSCPAQVGNFLSIVVIEGPCELLCYQKVRTHYTSVLVAPEAHGAPIVTASGISVPVDVTETRWIISYKDKKTLMKRQFATGNKKENDDVGFKEKCKEIFSSCPSLFEKIENKIYSDDNLNEIVAEFNQCIAGK